MQNSKAPFVFFGASRTRASFEFAHRFDTLDAYSADPLPLGLLGVDLATGQFQRRSGAGSECLTLVRAWWHGVFVGQLVVEDVTAEDLEVDQISAAFDRQFAEERVNAELLSSLGPPKQIEGVGYTVAVCTADRPDSLARCLASFEYLAPEVAEVIVVDNSKSMSSETEQVVAGFGYRYLREPVPGLDRARNLALVEARTELVLFADDDVELRTGWDRWLVDAFTDPLVMAAGGLVLAASLDSAAMISCEMFAPHSRGPYRKQFGMGESPGHVGVGASMAVRRDFLLAHGGFPEHLDAGTPTGTGGDTWAFAEVLRRGYRAVYEPRAVSFHWHRNSEEALLRMFEANATGSWALVGQAIEQGRRNDALAIAGRNLSWHRETFAQWRRKAIPNKLVKAEARGASRAPSSYWRATKRKAPTTTDLTSVEPPAPWLPKPTKLLTAGPDFPSVSLVIPTRGRRKIVVDLVRSVQTLDGLEEIVVVVDGDIDATEAALSKVSSDNVPIRIVVLKPESEEVDHGSGAAAARNAGAHLAVGDVLLFIDDDVQVPAPDFALRHSKIHAENSKAVAVGPALVDQRSTDAAGQILYRNWWVDHVARLRENRELGWIDICTGNLSIRKSEFDRLGGFDTNLPRREDWEFGLRAIDHGMTIESDYQAGVIQRDEQFDALSRDAFRDGYADSIITSRHELYGELVRPRVGGMRALPLYKWAYRSPVIAQQISLALRSPLALSSRFFELPKTRLAWRRVQYFAGRGAGDQHAGSSTAPFGERTPPTAGTVELGEPWPFDRLASGELHTFSYRGVELDNLSTVREGKARTGTAAAHMIVGLLRRRSAKMLNESGAP